MSKPLIGITAGEIINGAHPWLPVTYGQSNSYINSVIKAGGVPVIIPITKEEDVIDAVCQRIDGLLMSGGNDINPELYGEKPYKKLEDPDGLRDFTEARILKTVLKRDIPIFAICRGMQFINVYNGGSLYQDIKTDLPKAANHESSTEAKDIEHHAHIIKIEDSKLSKILGTNQAMTNTHHHQAIKKLGKGLKITARSDDNIVEAIETDDDRFIIGVQAHPESLGNKLPVWGKLFKAFVNAASK